MRELSILLGPLTVLPQATFAVNSETGLHLMYVPKELIPMYLTNHKIWRDRSISPKRNNEANSLSIPLPMTI